MIITPAALVGPLPRAQAQLHKAIWPRSLALFALVVAVLPFALAKPLPGSVLASWLAALGVRALVAVAHRRAADADGAAALWLLRHRLAFGLHGLA